MSSSYAPIVEFRNISKKFASFHANRNINLRIEAGEIHAIAGENGAGKSTLMNVLFGRLIPDAGSIMLRGRPLWLRSPRDAIRAGIGMVPQEVLFFPQLSVLENIILGSEPSRVGVIGRRAAEKEVLRLRDAFGFEIDPHLPAGELPFAARRQVELMRMLYRRAEILILDEPTSSLGPMEVEKFLDVLRSFRYGGRTVIFISHRLDEVFAVADKITVLRRGKLVETLESNKTCKEEIARLMVGRDDLAQSSVGDEDRNRPSAAAEASPLLDVEGLCMEPAGPEPRIECISFTVASGEIFGIAGVVGNGQRLLARALSGREKASGGKIIFGGTDITDLDVDARLRAGISRLPENPSDETLLPDNPLWENFLLGRQFEGEFQKRGIIRKHEALQFARDLISENGIAARSPLDPPASLSGGNRQKAALAHIFSLRPKLAILEQPSRGLDLHASARMRDRIFKLSEQGTAIIVLSFDLDELLSSCDRIAVIYRGKLMGTVSRSEFSRETLGRWMVGIGA